ncbi:hypothetical protein NPX13_g2835 [Xylaria arbuscula]|uniref:Transcription factor domain-containing protein n=1 Tax=Xylaria arbuscula TaxID=114810 RepID=A0A9W8NJG4_9PEZI|nr:hypothetical protein NPX13_g2835 [Xylaria arbuscula]
MEQKSPSTPRQKMNYACEACRAAKTRCAPSSSGSAFFALAPVLAGPKRLRESSLPPPPGPSKTFSIDFEMPAEQEPSDDFERLRQDHERILEDLVLNDDEEETMPEGGEVIANILGGSVPESKAFNFNDMSSTPSVSLSGTSSSWTESSPGGMGVQNKRPLMNLGIKPQFNLDSAAKLLMSFREMLPHMPCLVLPENLDVRLLARKSPFVLLAILAVTSCSSSLQGHSLYDEEFRKVLGLKFVAGGERSLELLQGILIYCAWYPFHLRPKNKQSYQYLRMGVDIVHDLEMDQEPDFDFSSLPPHQRASKLDDIRALLGCFYGMSAFSATWNRAPTFRYSPQLSRCAETLDRNSELEQDHHLAWLVRFQYIFEEIIEMQRIFERGPKDNQAIMQRNLIRAGLETQFRDFTQKMPTQYASVTSILLASQVTEAIMLSPGLVRMPRKFGAQDSEPSSSTSLLQVAHIVRSVFDHISSLLSGGSGFTGFAGADYGRFIIVVILAYRLSFPVLALCRDYNVAQGRQILDLGGFLRELVDSSEDAVPENEGDVMKETEEDGRRLRTQGRAPLCAAQV